MAVGAQPLARARNPSSLAVNLNPVNMFLYFWGSTWIGQRGNTEAVRVLELKRVPTATISYTLCIRLLISETRRNAATINLVAKTDFLPDKILQ